MNYLSLISIHKNQLSPILSAILHNDSVLFRGISGISFKIRLSLWIFEWGGRHGSVIF